EDHGGVEERVDPGEAGDPVIAAHPEGQGDGDRAAAEEEVPQHAERELRAREQRLVAVLVHQRRLLAASTSCSGRARTRKSSVRLTQRTTPAWSTRNSAGRATSCPPTPAPLWTIP